MCLQQYTQGFPDGSAGKESACNAGDTGDAGSIPGSGRAPGEAMAITPVLLPGKFQWTEEPGGLQPNGLQRVATEWLSTDETQQYMV